MTISRFSAVLIAVTLFSAILLGGCAGSKASTSADVANFKGENGKMPADFKTKMEAAQRNASQSQQQAAQKATQQGTPATAKGTTP